MNERNDEQTEEARIEALLQTVGPRAAPPEDLARHVREAVKGEWQSVVAERTYRRRLRTFVAAASFAAVASLGVAIAVMNSEPAPQRALVTRIEGHVISDAGWLHAARNLSENAPIFAGEAISTASDARVAFQIDDGLALRLDANTHVRLVDADRLVLEHGAVYVASDPAAERTATFIVATRNGSVRHIGTQYEVRTVTSGVQVSVREGRIVVDTEDALHEGKAGERIAIGDDGAINRTTLAQNDPHWSWLHRLAPGFDIENRSLDAFLHWFSSETGRKISFASPEAERAARATILRGSIEGLEPNAALTAVLATTDLISTETGDGAIVIRPREY